MRLALASIALATFASAASGQEVLTESWEDGSPKVQREVRRDAAGEPVDHGSYKRWYRTGKVAEEGTNADGQRTGEWVFRWESGRRKAQGAYRAGTRHGEWKLYSEKGKKTAQGKYRKGIRNGKWTFWSEDRKVDEARSGTYRSHILPDGVTRGWEGESRDGQREGRWTLYRTGRRPMMVGDYRAGLPEGPWLFLHADGTAVEEWFTGEYAGGLRTGALTGPPPGFTDLEEESDLDRVARPESSPPYQVLLETFFDGSADERDRARTALLAEPRESLPAILNAMLDCNLGSVREHGQARRMHMELVSAIFGASLPWSKGTRPDDVAENSQTVLRWHTLWELVAERDWIWRGELDPRWRWVEVDRSYTVVNQPPLPLGFVESAASSTGEVQKARRRGKRRSEGPSAAEVSLARALAWIAGQQDPSGMWRAASQRGDDRLDAGVTAICLLALLWDGNTPFSGEHADAVARGLRWFVAEQNLGAGILTTSPLEATYEHALGTLVLADAAARTGLPVLRQSCHRAVDYLTAVQRFDGAWAPSPEGPNGHPVATAEALVALWRARAAGIGVDDRVIENGLSWLLKRADRTTGETAGEDLGFLLPHSSAAATAAALVARLLTIPKPDEDPLVERQLKWLAGRPPVAFPDLDESDPHYVLLGSYAALLRSEAEWTEWNAAVKKLVLDTQIDRGDLAGAWDMRGRHARTGGGLWTTALSALTLEAYARNEHVPR